MQNNSVHPVAPFPSRARTGSIAFFSHPSTNQADEPLKRSQRQQSPHTAHGLESLPCFMISGAQPNFALQTGPVDPIALRARARTLRRVGSWRSSSLTDTHPPGTTALRECFPAPLISRKTHLLRAMSLTSIHITFKRVQSAENPATRTHTYLFLRKWIKNVEHHLIHETTGSPRLCSCTVSKHYPKSYAAAFR